MRLLKLAGAFEDSSAGRAGFCQLLTTYTYLYLYIFIYTYRYSEYLAHSIRNKARGSRERGGPRGKLNRQTRGFGILFKPASSFRYPQPAGLSI